ncbi:MAG: RNA polymerase factor sigma-54 [Dysgonamonadaceae bacterium]|jgi:RNA polymerase sigma-54 factor|nr:RNA polymerase factor sigma-54 [Dysgonamonadaceae bacterium]
MIRQQLTTRLQQKLSPLQIQQIKLLELNALEIENRINRELEDNPALEEASDTYSDIGDDNPAENYESADDDSSVDISIGDYLTEDDIPDYKLQQSYYSKENEKERIPYSEAESFFEYLINQLRLKNLSEDEFKITEYLIGNMDTDGYLRRDPEAISDDLAFQYSMDVSVETINKAIGFIKELDPPGVGATNLHDCLLLQLDRKEKTPLRQFAISILTDYFDAFSKKQYDKIIKGLGISENELKDAIKEITALNPRPGSAWEPAMETVRAQIIPDFYVETLNGELFFSMLERDIPELKINREYSDMLRNFSEGNSNQSKKDTLLFIKQKLDSAKWFIDAIKQRNATLEKTMLTIMEIQRDFFLSGEESTIKPMILKDVSKLCGYDISTVSRVSNSKYVQTNWGVFPLKYFFSEAMTNEEGEEVSTREIKAILKQCIDNEDKKNPLTDDLLMKELKNKGYDIARRTVAKYREQLNIPVARLRRDI